MRLHLINEKNEIVRSLKKPEGLFYVIRNLDTGRIEITTNLVPYRVSQIRFEILQQVSSEELNLVESTKEIQINGSPLKLVQKSEIFQKDVELNKDDLNTYLKIQKRTATTLTVLLLVGFLADYIITKWTEPEIKIEPQIVKIIERPTNPVVPMNPEPVVANVVEQPTKPKTNFRQTKNSNKKASTVKSKPPQDYLNFLGETNNRRLKPGLEVSSASVKSAGVGLGGSQGSGGVQTTQFGKGFFKRALGPGQNMNGQGGYGTRGAGGGQKGYGSLSIVGSGGTSLLEGLDHEATFEGGLGRDQISAVIHRHINEVRFCYEKGLISRPNLNGKVAINFMINPKGQVSLAEVSHSSLKATQVENCIRGRLRTWQFPKPVGGVNVKVTYPFVLKKIQDT